jgi:phosphate transport system substrate-binding protein
MIRRTAQAAAAIVVLAAPALCPAQPKTVKIDGSSTVYPITEAVAEEFQKEKKGAVNVTVGISGTGGGFKKFLRNEIDIADASRPIMQKELEEAKKNGIEFIELPVAFDALTVVINPGNDWAGTLTVQDLKKIWEPEAQGKVTNWKQVRESFPDAPLTLYGPGADSGTFDYFTEAIVGKAKSSRGDFTASEDDNVLVQGVEGNRNALGFFGYAYYIENKGKLKAVAIDAGKGKAVTPSEDTVLKAEYFPLSRPVFIYVNKKSCEKPEVKEFVEFYLQSVPELAREVKYVALPPASYKKVEERFRQMKTGTAFAGHAETGLHVDEILTRPLAN